MQPAILIPGFPRVTALMLRLLAVAVGSTGNAQPHSNYAKIKMLGTDIRRFGVEGRGGNQTRDFYDRLAELDSSVHVIDCRPNIVADGITARTGPAVKKRRAAHPDVLVEDRTTQDSFLIAGRMDGYRRKNRAARHAAWDRRQKDGVKNLFYIPGGHRFDDDGEGSTDRSHPNDLGFMRPPEIFSKCWSRG
jgi:hypothetical protein